MNLKKGGGGPTVSKKFHPIFLSPQLEKPKKRPNINFSNFYFGGSGEGEGAKRIQLHPKNVKYF